MIRRGRNLWLMLVLGLGSATKVYLGGAIALSELAVFAIAPYLFIRHYAEYRHSGITTVLWLALSMIPGCLISCLYNNVHWIWFVKSSMQFYSIFAMVTVFYFILREDFGGIGFFFVGLFISTIVSVFVLNPQVMMDERSTELIGQIDLETQLEGVMFWYPKIVGILRLPTQGWYFSVPAAYSVLAPIAAAATSALVSVSGRGAAATSLLSCVLIAYCRKSRARMQSFGRHFVVFACLGVVVAVGIKNLYTYSARSGLLGVEALNKYYSQTHGDSSFMRVLISGRTEFFIAIRAMIDNPILGIGPRAEDRKGYVRSFIQRYGDRMDYEAYAARILRFPNEKELIPQHSTLTQFWGHAGVCGLVFCFYYLYLVYLFFRRYAHCVPQWFGYFALAIPPSIFSLFFNPYSDRVGFPLLITCLLMARAVGQGRLQLPYEMEMEARKYD